MIKAIKKGNISYGGALLSVSEGQMFEGDYFTGLVDMYSDMFEVVSMVSEEPKKVEKVKVPEVKEVKEVKDITPAEVQPKQPEVKEGLLDSVKKVFTK